MYDVITSRFNSSRSGKMGSFAHNPSTITKMFKATTEAPSKRRIIGWVQGIRCPPRSRTSRPHTMEMDRKMAPRKSTLRSFESDDCVEVVVRHGIWSFQATRARANNVGGHCPRKVL